VTALIASFGGAGAAAARAYTIGPPSPELICTLGKEAATKAIEYGRQPANGAQVPFGTPVTFSAGISLPVTFTVAANPALMPPLLAGQTVEPNSEHVVSFTSAAAAASSGPVYWLISFSTSSLPECAELPPETVTLATRSLTVLSAPGPTVTATPELAPQPAPTPTSHCAVPRLRGMTLARARSALVRDGCRLGHISRPRHPGPHTLLVTVQSLAAGSKRPAGTAVGVTLVAPHRTAR